MYEKLSIYYCNSRRLHNTALRYARSVQLGAYMWQNWLNWLKMGSKWVPLSPLSTPNGPPSFLEKRVFDPSLVPNRPIFKAFWDFPRAISGLKMG